MSSRHDVGWDRIYHHPENLPWELGQPRNVLMKLVESRRLVPGKTLDVCCGVGTNTVYLAKNGFEVSTLDISDEAIRFAKEKAANADVEIGFLVGDFVNLPFRSELFDFVFDFGCFHHVQLNERASFIKGVQTVLKPNGTYLLVCFSYMNGEAWNYFTKEEIVKLFEGSFTIEKIKHVSSIEGDGIKRYFYEVLMVRLK
ncbi:MAG: class I SAM-dependent methyltransferase [Candidatus Bathyarchaeota archaeon]|nr:MAG: class I SAM-dependent methyltransferase [Candidatus Bathyarchaeota archaeon]